MAFIGNAPASVATNFQGVVSDSFNGTGSQTDFTLTRSVASVAWIEVLVDNVQQSPYDGSYSVTGTTLSFSGAPPSGTNNVYVVYRDQPLASIIDSTAYRQTEVDTLLDAKVSKAGDTMTGKLGIGSGTTPVKALHIQSSGSEVDRSVRLAYDGTYYADIVQLGATGVAIRNNGTDNMLLVDGAGRVTMPYQPAMFAQPNANGTVAVTTGATVYGWYVSGGRRFNRGFTIGASTLFGVNKKFDAENTGRITVLSAGVYSLYFDMRCESPGGSGQAGVWVNGVQEIRRHIEEWDTISYSHCIICATFNLQANDYLEMGMWWNSEAGGPLIGYGDTVNWMSLVKIA